MNIGVNSLWLITFQLRGGRSEEPLEWHGLKWVKWLEYKCRLKRKYSEFRFWPNKRQRIDAIDSCKVLWGVVNQKRHMRRKDRQEDRQRDQGTAHGGLKQQKIGPLVMGHSLLPLTRSLAPLTHSLAPHYSLRSRALLHSFARSLAH